MATSTTTSSNVIHLTWPLETEDGRQIERLTLRRVQARDVRALLRFAREGDMNECEKYDVALDLLARLAETPLELVERMDAADLVHATNILETFVAEAVGPLEEAAASSS